MTRPLPVLNVLHLPVSCLLLLLLSACGGGGGGGGSNSATSPISAAATGFSLQGSIAISAGSIVDSDINNAAQVTVSNNTPASAQRIPSFAVLGGYVNKAENGAAGPLFSAGDPLDYFSIYLYEAQSIVLDIYNADNADLDLYLLDANGQIILDSSLSATNATEQLSAPFEGQFQVLVEAFSGASSYTLRTEQTVNASSTGVRLSDAFLPNELIVRYRQPSLYTQQLYNAESSIRRHDLYRMSGDATRPMRLGINQRTPLEAQSLPADSSVAARLASGQLAFSEADFQDKYLTLQTLKALQHDKSILYAEANLQIQSAAIPNDARYDEQWNLPLIELPAAWDLTTGSNSVVVAVIDSGILSAHPDLAANLIAGYDFIAEAEDLGDSYHGSHVAGIIAGIGNNGIGTSGVAWNASIMPLRVLGENGGNLYDAVQALRYAAGLDNDSGLLPARAADIINMSIGGTGYCQSNFSETLSEVRDRGILVVAAAGNGSDSSNRFIPANCNDVFAVSAVGLDRALAPYSNSGNVIDLAAPGGRQDLDQDSSGLVDAILSQSASLSGSTLSYDYAYRFGTSMAAPHVSGVFALMLALNPALNVDDIEQMLFSGLLTDDLGIAGRDNLFGHGLINARKAVNAASDSLSGSSSLNSYLISSITGFEFRPSLSSAEFETRSVGEDPVSINNVITSENWLEISRINSVNDVEQWRLSVNRNGQAAGLYRDTVSFVTSSNTLNLDILLQVNDANQVYEMGPLEIRLLDSSSNNTVRSALINGLSGAYPFNFNNVTAGSYRLSVSSRLSGEGFGETGEASILSESFELNGNRVNAPLQLEWGNPLISSPGG